jgi:hypothetical protein
MLDSKSDDKSGGLVLFMEQSSEGYVEESIP